MKYNLPIFSWQLSGDSMVVITHWGRVTHIFVGKLTTIGSDNGLSPGRHQAIIWTNAGILLIGPLETNFSEILIGIQTLSFKKMHMKMSSAKWCPFCLGLNVIIYASKVTVSCCGMATSRPWNICVGHFKVIETCEGRDAYWLKNNVSSLIWPGQAFVC